MCVVVAAAYVDELHDGPSSFFCVIVVGFLVIGIRILKRQFRFLDSGFGREVYVSEDIPGDVGRELRERALLVVPLGWKAETQ